MAPQRKIEIPDRTRYTAGRCGYASTAWVTGPRLMAELPRRSCRCGWGGQVAGPSPLPHVPVARLGAPEKPYRERCQDVPFQIADSRVRWHRSACSRGIEGAARDAPIRLSDTRPVSAIR